MIHGDLESILVPEDNGKQKSGSVLYKQKSKTHCLQL